MTYTIPLERDPKYQFKWLLQCLNDNNMSAVRATLLELLDIGYSGNHAKELEPYKTQLIRMLLEFFKNESYHLTDALAWQLSELGVTWLELTTIRRSTQHILNRSK